jgi:hypothetical protein
MVFITKFGPQVSPFPVPIFGVKTHLKLVQQCPLALMTRNTPLDSKELIFEPLNLDTQNKGISS